MHHLSYSALTGRSPWGLLSVMGGLTALTMLISGSTGMPLEIYVFSNDQVWANYEALQADIFDHLIAILPYFDLRVFQQPSSYDFRTFSKIDSALPNAD